MTRLAALALLAWLLSAAAVAAPPQLRVHARLQPTSGVMVGGLVELQLDILTDTWFTDAPSLPELSLDNALVLPPAGQAEHLNERIDGQSFNGMRYRYRIAAQRAQAFEVPALTVHASPAQAAQAMSAQSEPLHFSAQALPGQQPAVAPVVASAMRLSQQVVNSITPLKVGDSITRQLTLQADGALAMTLPAPALGDVAGLSRYPKAPQVTSLDDGRGDFLGGQRVDTVTYRIDRAGTHVLPAVRVDWWDTGTQQMRTAQVPAVTFEAAVGSVGQPVFSLREDLKRLGRGNLMHVSRGWLWALGVLLALMLLAYAGQSLPRRLYQAWHRRRQARQQAWQQSPEYAWQHIGAQLSARPPQLSALYLWLRRSRLGLALGAASPDLRPVLRACYGRAAATQAALPTLRLGLTALRNDTRQQRSAPAPALRPLNPAHEKDLP